MFGKTMKSIAPLTFQNTSNIWKEPRFSMKANQNQWEASKTRSFCWGPPSGRDDQLGATRLLGMRKLWETYAKTMRKNCTLARQSPCSCPTLVSAVVVVLRLLRLELATATGVCPTNDCHGRMPNRRLPRALCEPAYVTMSSQACADASKTRQEPERTRNS